MGDHRGRIGGKIAPAHRALLFGLAVQQPLECAGPQARAAEALRARGLVVRDTSSPKTPPGSATYRLTELGLEAVTILRTRPGARVRTAPRKPEADGQ